MKLLAGISIIAILAILGGADTAHCAQRGHQAASSGKRIVNRIAATVNGRPVTSAEVRARLDPYLRELLMLYPDRGPRFVAELVKAKGAVLKELIDRELVLSEFETRGAMIPETVVDEELNRRILYQFNGKRDLLLQTLRQSGMSLSDFRESLRKETAVAAMRSSRYDRGIPPTPDEIRAEYDATKSDYRDITKDTITYDKIFIPAVGSTQDSTPEQQLALAQEICRKIKSGEMKFEEAARTYSADMHAQDGGSWPPVARADLAVEFANIVFSLPVGELAGPLLDPAGFTIVRVRGKRLAPAPPLSQVKDAVDDAVRRKQSEKRYLEWIERLRDKAVIRTFI